VSPTHAEKKENHMDTGKIFLGIALIACSVAMGVNPASAAGCDGSCTVGSGNLFTAECGNGAGLQHDGEYTAYSAIPVVYCISQENLP
jgi:hypothetical protein